MIKRSWLIAIGVIGVIIILSLIATSFLYGGFGNIAKDLKSMPSPQSKDVVLLREKVINEVQSEFAAIEKQTGLTNSGSEFLDECYKGQNNLKVQQGFAQRCSYRITQYYGFSGNFKTQMNSYLNGLTGLGWGTNSSYYTESIAMTYDYYGNVPAGSTPNMFLNGGVPAKKANFEMHLKYQDVRYLRDSLRDSQSVMLRSTIFKTFTNSSLVDVDATVDTIAKNNQYLLVISIEKDYFEN